MKILLTNTNMKSVAFFFSRVVVLPVFDERRLEEVRKLQEYIYLPAWASLHVTKQILAASGRGMGDQDSVYWSVSLSICA